MSDLAPFVAASLRDKVMGELLEENQRLRDELEKQKKERFIPDAIHGFDRVYRIAIVRPSPVEEDSDEEEEETDEEKHVYAIQYYSPHDSQDGSDLEFINECTLADLAEAEIYVNGVKYGPLNRLQPQFHLGIFMKEGRQIASLDDVLLPEQKTDKDSDWASFVLDGFSDRCGDLWFNLRGVSKEKWFDLMGVDVANFLANPKELELEQSFTFEELISSFGGDTVVDFEYVFDVSGREPF